MLRLTSHDTAVDSCLLSLDPRAGHNITDRGLLVVFPILATGLPMAAGNRQAEATPFKPPKKTAVRSRMNPKRFLIRSPTWIVLLPSAQRLARTMV